MTSLPSCGRLLFDTWENDGLDLTCNHYSQICDRGMLGSNIYGLCFLIPSFSQVFAFWFLFRWIGDPLFGKPEPIICKLLHLIHTMFRCTMAFTRF